MYSIMRKLDDAWVVVEDNLPSWGDAYRMLQFYDDCVDIYAIVESVR